MAFTSNCEGHVHYGEVKPKAVEKAEAGYFNLFMKQLPKVSGWR